MSAASCGARPRARAPQGTPAQQGQAPARAPASHAAPSPARNHAEYNSTFNLLPTAPPRGHPDEPDQESRPRLFRRPRHLGHPEVAAGRRTSARSSPSPPTSARARSSSRRAPRRKAAGVKSIYIDDLREEFVRDFVFPMFRANTVYEGEYLLGTSIARPLIAKRLVEIAQMEKADAISHGATGKGNDQVRFELGAYALMPEREDHRAVARMGPRLRARRCSPTRTGTASPWTSRSARASRRSRWTRTCCTSPTRAASSRTRLPRRRRRACGA